MQMQINDVNQTKDERDQSWVSECLRVGWTLGVSTCNVVCFYDVCPKTQNTLAHTPRSLPSGPCGPGWFNARTNAHTKHRQTDRHQNSLDTQTQQTFDVRSLHSIFLLFYQSAFVASFLLLWWCYFVCCCCCCCRVPKKKLIASIRRHHRYRCSVLRLIPVPLCKNAHKIILQIVKLHPQFHQYYIPNNSRATIIDSKA